LHCVNRQVIDYPGNSYIQNATGYLNVPYVNGVHPDQYDKNICKTLYDGYNGIECSGLAYKAGYTTAHGVGNTNVVRLKEHYQKGDEAGETNMTLTDFNNNPGNYSGRMWFLGSYHVGLFSYKNNQRWVIHASSTEDKVEWKNIGDPSSGWEAEWDGFGAPVDEGCGGV